MALPIEIDRDAVAVFCRRNHIQKLALFGSVLTEDFEPESDVDVLVEFAPGHTPGLFSLASMEEELSTLFRKFGDLLFRS